MARQAHASSDSTVLDNRDRWRSVCCKYTYSLTLFYVRTIAHSELLKLWGRM